MPLPEDGRSPVARGVFWASQITTIGFMFTVPAIGGFFADQKLGTKPWLLITGTIMGFLVGMLELIKLAQRANQTVSQPLRTLQTKSHQPVSPLPDQIDTAFTQAAVKKTVTNSDHPDSR